MGDEEKTSWRKMFESLEPGLVEGWAARKPEQEYDVPTTETMEGKGKPNGQEWYERRFDAGHRLVNGWLFTIWTADRVYFPACYDGAEWIASVPRHPCAEAVEHVGGG